MDARPAALLLRAPPPSLEASAIGENEYMGSLTDLAADLDVSTEQVLTALRVVATRAGVEELAEWAAKELEGYTEEDELPTHRRWELTIVANLYNPYQAFVSRAHVPIAREFREKATIYHCRDGIGQIESALSAGGSSEPMGVEHPNLAQVVNASIQRPWTCVQANAEFSSLHLKSIVDRARQTALKLCLECEKKGIMLQYYGKDDYDTTPHERKAWITTLKQEGAKLAIKEAWMSIRDRIFEAAASIG